MDATAYLLAGSPEAERAVAEKAAREIELGSTKFLDIVLSLKQYVEGDDLVKEAKAVEYLSCILECLNPSVLSRQDVALVCRYLQVRIGIDHAAGLKESAIALKALASMSHFDPKQANEICEKVFSMSDSFNEHPVVVRIEVYRLLDFLMEKCRYVLKQDSLTYIPGLLSLAELEKDPRNLMLYFSILFVILSEWNVDECAGRLWDAVSKYFPITFRPRPNDPISITADDLKIRLRQCISATSDFAPMVFPFLIQKLDHQVNANVKKDVMQTMTACITSYDIHSISAWSGQIWNALKYEILSATETDLAEDALGTLKAIAARLSAGELTLQTLSGTMLFHYVDMVNKECIKHFHNKTYVKQSGQILGEIAAGSPFSLHLVVKNIFPTLIAVIQHTDALGEKRELIEVLNRILDARSELVQAQELSQFPSLAILDAVSESCPPESVGYGGLTFFHDALFEIFSMYLTNFSDQEISLRSTALKGLLKLVQLPQFLAQNEVGMVIQQTTKLILDNGRDELRKEAIHSLQQIAQLYPQVVEDISFPALLATLPDVVADKQNVLNLSPVLEAFACIALHSSLFPVFIRRLMNKIEDVFRKGLAEDPTQTYARAILASILYCLRQREMKFRETANNTTQLQDSARSRDIEHYRFLVRSLCAFFTTLASRFERPDFRRKGGERYYIKLRPLGLTENSMQASESVIELVGMICMTAVRSMDIAGQNWAASGIFTLFAAIPPPISTAQIIETQLDIEDATDEQLRTLIISYSLLAGIRREVSLDFDPHLVCCTILERLYIIEEHKSAALWPLCILLGLLVNKWDVNLDTKAPPFLLKAQNLSIKEILADQLEIKRTLDQHVLPDIVPWRVTVMAVLLTNAINLRGDRATRDLLKMLVEKLENERIGAILARHFKFPHLPSEIFCEENFALIRGLYKQRPFAICFPMILERYKASSHPDAKRNYLVALSGILENTPADIILPEIEKLMPVVLQSMQTLDLTAKSASIEVLRSAIIQSPSSIEEHIRSVIARLLDAVQDGSHDPADAQAKVREMAVRCLAMVPVNVKDITVFPFKFEVLRKLENTSRDIKRNVREAAVQCRYAWFNLAVAAEEDD